MAMKNNWWATFFLFVFFRYVKEGHWDFVSAVGVFQLIKLFWQINDLHDVLERLQNNQIPPLRKKQGYLPVVRIFSKTSFWIWITFKISHMLVNTHGFCFIPSVTQETSVR